MDDIISEITERVKNIEDDYWYSGTVGIINDRYFI